MTSVDHPRPTVRTYGGWRRTRGIGLFGAGPAVTVVVLGCLITPMLLAAVSLRAGAIALLPAAVVSLLALTRVDGVSLAHLAIRRTRWTIGTALGWAGYRATSISEHPRAWDLPGVLAPTRLITALDHRDRPFGLVWHQRTGHLTATLLCAAASTWLVDDAEADGWVANWHAWLASLGYLPMIRSVAVTVDTAPEPGTTLQGTVLPRIAPTAPVDVQHLLRELVARSPAASADVETRVSITFDPAASPQRLHNLDAAAAEVGRVLTGLESGLATCGVAVLGRARAADIAGAVRAGYDPASRGETRRLLAGRYADLMLTWADAGPVAAQEMWSSYLHDGGLSVTWGWHEAPRQQVTSGVLARLLSPGRFAKRVTIVYRPLPAGDAARLLEAQVNAAAFRDAYRRAQKRDESARDLADRARAERAAAEEAQGAGVVVMSMYVTVTVTKAGQLAEAVADIESRADQSKIRLRRLYGGQAAGFAATLPVGPVATVGPVGISGGSARYPGGGRR